MEQVRFNMNPYTFTGRAVLIGFLLIDEFTVEELDSIGNWLQVVGLIMQIYASQVSTIQSVTQQENQNINNNDDIEILKKTVIKIEEELGKIKDDYNC